MNTINKTEMLAKLLRPRTLEQKITASFNIALANNSALVSEVFGEQRKAANYESAWRMAAAIGIHQVKQDIRDGRVPKDVPSFSDLHDYVDANEYGLLCSDELFDGLPEGDEAIDARGTFANFVQGRIAKFLEETLEHRARVVSTTEL
jgi:hypothetical protein